MYNCTVGNVNIKCDSINNIFIMSITLRITFDLLFFKLLYTKMVDRACGLHSSKFEMGR